ncbi:MAG: transposase [Holophagae bacterium]|nr:transposase [Holophagae bacterium]
MSRIKRIEVPDGVFHVICRGNGRQDIFHDRQDREQFLRYLSDSLRRYELKLHAYVLMDNHVHLLLQTPHANLSPFMQQFNVRYTGWYNWKYNHSGHLYQGPYKRILVEQDSHLAMVSRYIHSNPVHVRERKEWPVYRQMEFIRSYQWSSLPGILDPGICPWFLSMDLILADYQGNTHSYLKDIESDLKNNAKPPEPDPLGFFGSINFVREMVSKFYGGDSRQAGRHPGRMIVSSPETIIEAIASVSGIKPEKLLTERDENRQLLITLLADWTGLTGRGIAEKLGITESTVSVSRKRFKEKLRNRQELTERMGKVIKALDRLNS